MQRSSLLILGPPHQGHHEEKKGKPGDAGMVPGQKEESHFILDTSFMPLLIKKVI